MPFTHLCLSCKRVIFCALFALPLLSAATSGYWTDFHNTSPTRIDPKTKRVWKKLVRQIRRKDASLQRQIFEKCDSLKKDSIRSFLDGETIRLLGLQVFELQRREPALHNLLKGLKGLRKSKVVYSVRLGVGSNDESETYYEHPSIQHPQGMIVLQVAGIGTFVHESTHGVQFDAGGMAFRKDRKGVFGEDIFDEVEAYRSQYSFEPDSLIGPPFPPEQLIFKRIDTAWVRRLESRNGRIYSCGGSANVAQVRLTIYSGWEEIREGYHCDSELDRKYPPGYKPTNDSTLYYNAQNRRVAPR